MIVQGLTIAVVGMCIVFIFLILLVLAVMLYHVILKKFFPSALRQAVHPEPRRVTRPTETIQADTTAAIAAAIAAVTAHTYSNKGKTA